MVVFVSLILMYSLDELDKNGWSREQLVGINARFLIKKPIFSNECPFSVDLKLTQNCISKANLCILFVKISIAAQNATLSACQF